MPLNEIPKYISPETRSLIDSTLEQAWQELKRDGPADIALARRKLAGTLVALASLARPTRRSLNGSLCMPLEAWLIVHSRLLPRKPPKRPQGPNLWGSPGWGHHSLCPAPSVYN
jgi:hypothetical protein